ncbi:sodium-dependent glucose transporter 1-like [Saccostrea cucullata]|uniref:sodium-dependent glucose transporter 1-like n=1 Tax=Saccostrea cuccullata TaxID=36930 RepID=UPI002ED69551
MSTVNEPGQGDILMQDLQTRDPSKLTEEISHTLEDDGRCCYKLKNGLLDRSKCVFTVTYIIFSFTLGLANGVAAHSFADLIHIADTTVRKGLLFYTMDIVGYLLGTLLMGYLFDKPLLDRNLLMFLAIVGYCVIVAIIPWCGMYEIMFTLFTVKGAFRGGLLTCGTAGLVTTWGTDGNSYLFASDFTVALGSSVSSSVVSPFALSHDVQIPIRNYTDTVNCIDNIYATIENNGSCNNVHKRSPTGTHSGDRSSMIYIPFTITTGLCFMTSLPFIVLCCISLSNKTIREFRKENEGNNRKQDRRLQIWGLINIIIYIAVYGVLFTSYQFFLPIFIAVHMNRRMFSSLFTSGFRLSFSFGNFFGIFLVKCVSPAKMLLIFNSVLLTALLGFILTSLFDVIYGALVFTMIVTFSLSVTFPVLIMWINQNFFRVNGKVISVFLFTEMVSVFATSFIAFDSHWFIYLLCGKAVFLFLLYLTGVYISRKTASRQSIIQDEDLTSPVWG